MSRSATSLSKVRHPRASTAEVISSEAGAHPHRRVFHPETAKADGCQKADTRRNSDAWVRQYRPLVKAAVRELQRKAPPRGDRMELVGQGYEALVKARQRFDPDRGVPFGAYAKQRVRGAVMDAIRRQWAQLGTVVELEDPHLVTETVRANNELADVVALADAASRLPQRDRLLFGLYYEAGLNLQEVADIVSLSASHICQLLRRSREKIQLELTSDKKSSDERQAFDGTAERFW